MKLVYRVENILGEGPYRTTNVKVDRYVGQYCHTRNNPAPYSDDALRKKWYDLHDLGNHKTWKFGFADINQLKKWFRNKKVHRNLQRNGFFISVYRVPNKMVHIGDTQAIFIRDSGRERMIKTISFDSLEKSMD